MNWLRNLTVSKKLYLLLGLTLVGIGVVGAISFRVQHDLSQSAEDIGHVRLPAVRDMSNADMMHDGLRAVALRAMLAAEAQNAADLEGAKQELEEFSGLFRDSLAALEALPLTAAVRAAIDEVRPELDAYVEGTARIVTLSSEGRIDEAHAALVDFQTLFERLEAKNAALSDLIEAEAQQALLAADDRRSTGLLMMWSAIGAAAIVSFWLGSVIARMISRPLANAVTVLESGDMTKLADVKSADEIGKMARAVLATVERMERDAAALAEQKRAMESSSHELARKNAEVEEALRKAAASAAEATRVASMVENSPACMLYADQDLVVRYANPAAKRALARLGIGECVGASLERFYRHPQGNAAFFGRRANLPFETRFESGREVVDLVAAAIGDTGGSTLGLLMSWEIATERVAAEREVEAARSRELAQAEELKAKVDRLLAAVDAAARGDLTVAVPIRGEDAIGRMGTGLERLLTDMRASISRIRDNAQKLSGASKTLTSVSSTMTDEASTTSERASVVSTVTTQLSHNVQTVAAGTEQMSNSIQEISRNTAEAASVARRAVTVAEETNAAVSRLGTSSEEIGQILKVITSIAQQTNLLALNATIEAARAGEAGKGFAVVANEVKDLAKETAKATEDIRTKIDAIQQDTSGAVAAIEQIGEIIRSIDRLQTSIAGAVEEQHATTQEITANLNEAAKGSNQIVESIKEVAGAAHSTKNGATNTSKVSQDLSGMSGELLELVGRFRC
ncbi:MAG: methyl-accepting chemotaxis protein [Planctomycetes bacterium]|nr:methyl-accepting chemotaxis protein [Planctomycetota bacterium]